MPDIILEADGISGDLSVDGYVQNMFLCNSFSFSASQPIDYTLNNHRTTGTINLSNISLTRFVDISSVQLMAKMFQGHTWPITKLHFLKAGDEAGRAKTEFLTIEMTNTIISDIAYTGSGNGEQMDEVITLNFTKIKFTYKAQDEKSSLAGSVTATWDLLAKKNQ
jgi:type VI secretion system secreted protein Hcp